MIRVTDTLALEDNEVEERYIRRKPMGALSGRD
jgi:hypothetical protein